MTISDFKKARLTAGLFIMSLGAMAPPLAAKSLVDEFNLDKLGYSAVPIVGYDDKSGWIYGAAGFAYNDTEPGVNAAFFGVTNLNDFHSATFNYEQRKGRWLYDFHGLSERAFDNYYGEGDLTSPDSPLYMSIYHFEMRPAILYKLADHFRVGLFDDYRSRLETDVERSGGRRPGDPRRLFPDENTQLIGTRVNWDTRDKIVNTRAGDYFQMTAGYSPGAVAFWQFNVDLRRFDTIYYHLVLADHFLAAVSSGEPSYLFRYRMGGLDTLRGYKDNRFRGQAYFVWQEELRYYVSHWLAVNASVDVGDIAGSGAFSEFHQLKLTGQLGLRLGLPPDFGQKLRIDLAYGYDQQTFQIQFGEIF